MDLCDFLTGEGILAAGRAKEIRNRARQMGRSLVREILDRELVSGRELVERLAARTGMNVTEPTREEIDEDVLRLVPLELAAKHLFLPLGYAPQSATAASAGEPPTLRAALCDPFSKRDIEGALGLPIEGCLTVPYTLERLIEQAYAGMVTRVMSAQPSAHSPSSSSPSSSPPSSSSSSSPSSDPTSASSSFSTSSSSSSSSSSSLSSSPTSYPLHPERLDLADRSDLADLADQAAPAVSENPRDQADPAARNVRAEPAGEPYREQHTRKFLEPSTVPSHNVEDEVSPSVRIQALVNLLVEAGVIDREAYLRELRRIMEEEQEQGL
jgi:hypothetical protein